MKSTKSLILVIALAIFGESLFSQTPAFPTAEGYGMWASGGRGGKVVEVINLEDKDKYGNPVVGGFRWALAQYPGEPITVVFKVSGIIDLKGSDLRCKRDGVTVAGQTAPGDGICIKGGKVNFGGSTNLIIRHMRFRVGLLSTGGFIDGAALGLENGGRFIIDHCTFGWSGEENMTIYDDTALTIQWCIIHEGLYDVGHPKGVRSYGSQWGGQSSTYHHNLLAHNVNRTPRFNGARSNDHIVLVEYVNNVNYNWGKENSPYGADFDAGGVSHKVNMVNNYYKPGPARPGTSASYFVQSSFNSEQNTSQIAHWYMSGNYMEGSANTAKNTDNTLGLDASAYIAKGVSKDKLIDTAAFAAPYPVTTESAQDAFLSVLAGAGAFPRDTNDRRIIHEVETGTAIGTGNYSAQALGIIDNPDVVGGFPVFETYHTVADNDHDGMADYWEVANDLDTTDAEDRNIISYAGYTNLEVYLNGLAGEYIDSFSYPTPIYTDPPEDTTAIINRHAITTQPKISTYMNYSESVLVIQSEVSIRSVTLFDMHGRKVGQYRGLNLTEINVSELSKGLYIAQFETESKYIRRLKFIR
ncbi:MAG: T9SS type A sorting domain-containing protein [Bacteroidales bacterium]|nr:T9SS type A sorting domain-containing protein [Bacteroidales bacterium]